jgi:hypothetical protein
MSHELALQKALIAHLKADAGLAAILGGRIVDAASAGTPLPHLQMGRCESRPLWAEGGGVEQMLTLTITSDFRGTEEAKAAMAAVRLALSDVTLEADGIRTASVDVRSAAIRTSPDGHRTHAVLRVRAVTEEA